jgi:phage gp29-like protein
MADETNNTDERVLFEPSYWGDSSTDWTLPTVQAAMAEADAGSLLSAADLCDAMWTDARVRGTMTTRVGALLGLNNDQKLAFETYSDASAKAITEDWWRIAPEPELSKLLRWGFSLGIGAVFHKVTKRNRRWIPRIKTWHPRFMTFNFAEQAWQIQTANRGTITVREGDPDWTFFTPYGETRPWAEGLWRTIALYWLINARAIPGWGKHNEVYASGAIVGKLPEGKSTKDPGAQKFWSDLKSLAKNARIVMPAGYELSVLEASGATWETFPRAMEMANTAIAIATIGQPLTTEVPNAAHTGATSASAVRQDYLEFDAEQTSTWAHDGPLTRWADLNYGDKELAPWLKFATEPPADLSARASTLKTAGEAGQAWLALGVPVDLKAYAEEFKLPVVEGAPFAAPKAAPPAPQLGTEKEQPHGVETLAAGKPSAEIDGFIRGQLYTDGLADKTVASASRTDHAQLDDIMRIIESIDDAPGWPGRLKMALGEAYGSMMPDAAMVELLEKAMVLAELAGMTAVLEDL